MESARIMTKPVHSVSIDQIIESAMEYFNEVTSKKNGKNKAREGRRVLQANNKATKKGTKTKRPKNKTTRKRTRV